MYHELMYHLDLCILAYHQYTQSLVWPFDPYYERLALKGSSRRENFMTQVRALFLGNNAYHGPGNTHGWAVNNALDPIVGRYDRLHPWRVAFCSPEPGNWLCYKLPTYITDRIASVAMCSYQAGAGNPNNATAAAQIQAPVARPLGIGGGGADRLYDFEGGTGTINGTPNVWSLMGCVLERHHGGTYDVHIAFRGSRSGSGARALTYGLAGKGNPDWVTDMDFNTVVQDNYFSVHGSVCRGFSRSVKTSIPSILTILQHIHAQNGAPPANIYVTGHSLGGALATQFATAMVLGTTHGPDGANLPGNLPAWPWRSLKLITFSAPVAGGKSFHRQFNSKIFCRRVVLSQDPITQDKRGYHVGSEVYVTGENTFNPVPLAYHEPMNVRERLYRKATQWGDALINVPGPNKNHVDFPWKVYDSFRALYQDQASLHPAGVLNGMLTGLDGDVLRYLGAVATVLEDSGAYKSFIRESKVTARSMSISTASQRMGNTVTAPLMAAPNTLAASVQQVREQFGEVGKHLSFALMLAELARNPALNFNTFLPNATLNECIQ